MDTGISDFSANRLLHASTEEAGEDRLFLLYERWQTTIQIFTCC